MNKRERSFLRQLPGISMLVQNALLGEVRAADLLSDIDHVLYSSDKTKPRALAKLRQELAQYALLWHPSDGISGNDFVHIAYWNNYTNEIPSCAKTSWFVTKLFYEDFHAKLSQTTNGALICHISTYLGKYALQTVHTYKYPQPMESQVSPDFQTYQELCAFMNERSVRKG
ncbi:MAG: hypothetical protein KA175_12390 [Flavobacteriales bacterium]|nr:hypothetical protein [Flavobacteriales bacterium]MBP7407810.1 hypothetical protein [Flavobacteriales bacterium]